MVSERTFKDGNGIDWRVSCVSAPEQDTPDAPSVWLSFESMWMERRLSPVPQNWQTATLQRLEQMCRIATAVQRDDSKSAAHAAFSDSSAGSGSSAVEHADDAVVQSSSASSNEHVSRLVNAWPAREPRITFRG
jgi:hypothetical protein